METLEQVNQKENNNLNSLQKGGDILHKGFIKTRTRYVLNGGDYSQQEP